MRHLADLADTILLAIYQELGYTIGSGVCLSRSAVTEGANSLLLDIDLMFLYSPACAVRRGGLHSGPHALWDLGFQSGTAYDPSMIAVDEQADLSCGHR